MKRVGLKWLYAWLLVLFFSCSKNNDPTPKPDNDNLVAVTAMGSRSAAELKFFIQLSGRDIDTDLFVYNVDLYKVVYQTHYKGSEVNASGLILLPKTTLPVPMISFQHGTLVEQAQAPSAQTKDSEEVIPYQALASMGFITVVPDLIGFGESNNIFHPYYVEEPTATAVMDMLRAAHALAKEKNVDFNSRLFLAGYSQGGYATLATHKALEASPREGFQLIASFPGAGGYDITSMQEYLFGLDTYSDPYYLAYVGLSYQKYYEEPGLLADFFNEPYPSSIPSLFDGNHSPADINAALTEDIKTLIREEILTGGEDDPEYDFLQTSFEENSLVDWKPTLPIFLYHGDADTTVPLQNSQITYDKLLSNGASPENLQLITIPGGNHSSSVIPYLEDVIKKLQTLK